MKTRGIGSPQADLGSTDIASFLESLLSDCRSEFGKPRKVLIVPPDQTRIHSKAGEISLGLSRLLGPALAAVIPAIGTHRAMDAAELDGMFPGMDHDLFRAHDHRGGTRRLGEIEASFIESVTGGRLSFAYPASYNRDLVEGGWDLVLSVGQVVPHEVVGMANYSKNLVVGLGGAESIDLSHWMGAICGIESIMGKVDTPVRRLFDESAGRFLSNLPIVYILTVVSRRPDGSLALRGIYAGPGPSRAGAASQGVDAGGGRSAFAMAGGLSAIVNIESLPSALDTCVVYLDPGEFRSTWLGNKAIYRTRMAMADGGELFILAPGVDRFGEDAVIDGLIRRHGYRGSHAVLSAVDRDPQLAANLAAAAHLVHGSSEDRFRITYCTDISMRDAIVGVGYSWMELGEARRAFLPREPVQGWNEIGGRSFYYVSNPALGLWKRAEM